ncbi:MAG: DciA family protein [Parcubacteria group bacterium]|jgi:hypothetical protein
MKVIGKILAYKKIKKKRNIDSDSVFYIFKNVIRVKYGEMGILNIKPEYYKEGVLFLRISNSNWANELWLNKKMIIAEINKKIEENEVKEIKLQ